MSNEDYLTPDPWGYQTNPNDFIRKYKIISIANRYAGPFKFKRALDLGCGEGWISTDLPATIIHGYEKSENAKKRLPANVYPITTPIGNYDLVLATGVLYSHYDTDDIFDIIYKHSTKIVITCNIVEWEINFQIADAKEIHSEVFKYREFTQHLRVFRKL